MTQPAWQRVFAAIDAANAEDPRREATEGGERPTELVYGRRMSAALEAFAPEASEALRIAARGQHIERWVLPRSDYPMDRPGYLRWRQQLKLHHAQRLTELMQAEAYDEASCARVRTLVTKKGLKTDAEVQTLEDVVCLVFVQHYFLPFAAKHPEAKVVDIVRKTWAKMSEAGHAAALALPLPDEATRLIRAALSEA